MRSSTPPAQPAQPTGAAHRPRRRRFLFIWRRRKQRAMRRCQHCPRSPRGRRATSTATSAIGAIAGGCPMAPMATSRGKRRESGTGDPFGHLEETRTMSTTDEEPTYEPYDYRRAAKHTAEHESVADGLRNVYDRIEALYELSLPLHDIRLLHEHDPHTPRTLTPDGVRQLTRLLNTIGHLRDHYGHHRATVEDAPTAAPDWDPIHRTQWEWKVRHALRCWWASEDLVRRMPSAKEQERYERAIAVGLEQLQRFTALDDLVTHYFDDRQRYGADMPDYPDEGTVEAWVQAARRAVPGGQRLVHATIEDASFWRRACQLDPTLAERDLWAD